MGTVRDFVNEDHLPCDPEIEYYANFYIDTGKLFNIKDTFGDFYNRVERIREMYEINRKP